MAQSSSQFSSSSSVFDTPEHQTIPLWRDIRVIQVVLQAIFAIVVIAVIFALVNNILNGLAAIARL